MITYDSIAAMKLNRILFDYNNQLNKINKQIDTGSTINKAADEPAIFNLTARVKGYSELYSVANNNAVTGISMIDTELNAISSMQDKLDEIKDILDKANKAGVSDTDRAEMQVSIDVLVQDIYKIRQNTEFNGLQIFQLQGFSPVSPGSSPSYNSVSPFIDEVIPKTDEELEAEGYVVVHDAQELRNAFYDDTAASIALGADIDLQGINWVPLGSESDPFYGIFEGNGHKISNLTIDIAAEQIGLFGYVEDAIISNVALENVNVNGYQDVGALVGSAYGSIIENSYVSGGTVSATSLVGGLVGNAESTTITKSFAELDLVSSSSNVVGGFVGNILNSTISESYSNSYVQGSSLVGGFSGLNTNSSVSNSYSSGTVKGNIAVGGFSGRSATTTIRNSYNDAIVTGTSNVGGFIGEFVGSSSTNVIENSFFNYETSTQSEGVGSYLSSSPSQTATLYGINSEQMQTPSVYTSIGWDENIWFFEEGENPSLKDFDYGPFPDKPEEPTYYGPLKAVTGPIRVQTGKDNTTDSYVMVDTAFDFDNNFSFTSISKKYASQSLDNLEIVQNQLKQKAYELGLSRTQLVSEESSTSTKVKKANQLINALTGVDKDALQEAKNQLLADITNTKALRDSTAALNAQMCTSLILGAIYGNRGVSGSAFSPFSASWFTNLLSS